MTPLERHTRITECVLNLDTQGLMSLFDSMTDAERMVGFEYFFSATYHLRDDDPTLKTIQQAALPVFKKYEAVYRSMDATHCYQATPELFAACDDAFLSGNYSDMRDIIRGVSKLCASKILTYLGSTYNIAANSPCQWRALINEEVARMDW